MVWLGTLVASASNIPLISFGDCRDAWLGVDVVVLSGLPWISVEIIVRGKRVESAERRPRRIVESEMHFLSSLSWGLAPIY
jgi:hypothetical protein